jgi:AAA+ ATPase superfamily predicted ATPase
MESIMGISLGGYLDKLENEFGLITKIRPVLSKPAGKVVKYRIDNNFLIFWFRFIYKYRGAVEMENFDYVKTIIERDYNTYSGQILERYFRAKISAENNLSQIGSYWETGNQNEIDIVALNEYEKTAIIAEVKRQSKNINLNILEKKAENLVVNLKGYTIDFRGFSIEDM